MSETGPAARLTGAHPSPPPRPAGPAAPVAAARPRATPAPTDWTAYYDREADLRRFIPEQEPYEEHRVRLVYRLLGDLRPGRILDAGCGDGYLCDRYGRDARADRAFGADLSHPRLTYAARRTPGAGFVNARIDRLPFTDGAFPLVSAVEVIEHLEDPAAAIREVARVAARHVLVTVPSEQVPAEALCPNCLHRFPVDGHLQIFTLARLEQLCREAGLRVVRAERYFVPAGWEGRGPFRLMGAAGRRLFRRLLERLGLLAPARAKYLGVLCEKPPQTGGC